MLKSADGLKAKQAAQDFATTQTSNGKREGPPGNGRGRSAKPAKSRSTDQAASSSAEGQAQSRDGQHDNKRYAKGEFFVAPRAALVNPAIGDLAFRVLCYALAKGRDWVCVWYLRNEFGVGEQAMRTAMGQLVRAGHAR